MQIKKSFSIAKVLSPREAWCAGAEPHVRHSIDGNSYKPMDSILKILLQFERNQGTDLLFTQMREQKVRPPAGPHYDFHS